MIIDLTKTYSLLDFSEKYSCKTCNTLSPFVCWNNKINEPDNPAGSYACKICDIWISINKEGRVDTIRYGAVSCVSYKSKEDNRIYNLYVVGNNIGEDIKVFDTDKLDKYLLLV